MNPEIVSIIIGVTGAVIGSIWGVAWKVSGWVKEITMRLDAINARLGDGQVRMERLEERLDDHQDRLKVLETDHRRLHCVSGSESIR